MSPLNANSHNNGGACNHTNHIKHPVSKMDTLAGVAIKYGVEVADIKRLNGLATDLQMFALKTLLIPLPGRHPPSPALCSTSSSSSRGTNGHDKTPPRPRYSNFLESFESLGMKSTEENISPAMSTLQKFYGLKSSKPKNSSNGTEMAVHRTRSSDFLNEDFLPSSPHIAGSSTHYLKSRNSADSLTSVSSYTPLAEAGDAETEKSNEKFVRRRGSSGFSPAKDGLFGVRKSSSTPSLHDQESGNSSSVWPTSKWSLKPDLQAFSSAGLSIPIFDGLPKPISGRKSKTALD